MKHKPLTTEERITTEEVARIALGVDGYLRDHIGHELDLCDEELEKLYQRLRSLAGFEQGE